ncbi:MAG: hypothetical protein M3O89_05380 [Actinomycetota bacterium]|nr:hypothetical protein [Actinomycetota bacterium]
MSDDQRPARPAEHDEPQDEVEAHSKVKHAANEEPAKEGDAEVEVEAHHHIRHAKPRHA